MLLLAHKTCNLRVQLTYFLRIALGTIVVCVGCPEERFRPLDVTRTHLLQSPLRVCLSFRVFAVDELGEILQSFARGADLVYELNDSIFFRSQLSHAFAEKVRKHR